MTAESTPLMERETGGLRVELHHWNGITGIVVTDHDAEPVVQSVPSARALDAFWHPFVYIDPEATAVAGERSES